MKLHLPSRPRHLATWSLCGGLLLLVAACSQGASTSGQTGGEIESTDDRKTGVGYGCEEVGTTALEVDEVSAIGVTAQELIDAISGTHETTLVWGASYPANKVTLTPAPGETGLTIDVRAKPETAVLVDLEEEDPSDGEADFADDIAEPAGALCRDELRAEAEVTVTSDNGAFSDTFDMVFSTRDGQVVTGAVEFEFEALAGSFAVDVEGKEAAVDTRLILNFAFGAVSGEVSGVLEYVDENSASTASVTYGRFPVEGCWSGTLVGADSEWGEVLSTALSDHETHELAWNSKVSTTLTVESTMGTICFEEGTYGDGDTLIAPLSARVSTADGRIDADWQLEARASVVDGAITEVVVVSVAPGDGLGHAPADFQSATGIAGVMSTAEALSFQFEYSMVLAPAPLASQGTLSIVELVIPDCARPDYEPVIVNEPGGGQSTSGCAGIDFVALETATFIQVVLR